MQLSLADRGKAISRRRHGGSHKFDGTQHAIKPTADCMRKCKVHVLVVVFASVREPSQQARHPLANTVFRFLSHSRKVHSLLIIVRNERRLSNYRNNALCDTSPGNIPRQRNSPTIFLQVNGSIKKFNIFQYDCSADISKLRTIFRNIFIRSERKWLYSKISIYIFHIHWDILSTDLIKCFYLYFLSTKVLR